MKGALKGEKQELVQLTIGIMQPPATNGSTAAALNDDAMEQKIQQCLNTLKGKRDEHKFAGLLMVTKLNELPWERLQQVRQQVVATVGVKFFLRLLHTKGTEGDALSPFQTLGLNLIASFCTDAAIAEQFADENLVRFLLGQLDTAPPLAHHIQEDCVRILNGVIGTAKGNQLFLNESILTRVCDTIQTFTTAAIDDRNADEETKSANKPTLTEVAVIEAMWLLVEKLSRSSDFWNKITSDSLAFLSTSLAHTTGKVALSVLAVWNNYLALVDDGSLLFTLQTTELDALRAGVYQFLRTKWPHQERDECLKFIYRLMKHTGTSWMVAAGTPSYHQQQDVSCGKFMLFILKLTSIEIKLMLDDVELTLVQMEEKKLEQVEESERQAREVQRVLHVLPVCYGIVEMIIDALVASVESEDGDDDESGNAGMLPYEILLEMKQSFGQVFGVILECLTLAREYMKTHRYRELLERSDDSVYQLDAVVYASVRVVSAWIAEDSDSCMDQLVDLVPFLVVYEPLTQAPVTPSGSTVATGANEGSDVDSDDELDSDDEVESPGSESMVQPGESTNIDQLHFLLPGLLQISATREGAMAMSQDLAVLRRLLRFCCSLCASISDGANEQVVSLPTLTLALGMLVNLLLVFNEDEEQQVVMANSKGRLPNASEWFRALSFLLPLACASGSDVVSDNALSMEDRGEDDRYVMLLHVVCAVLLIASHSDKNSKREATTNKNGVTKLVAPFNAVVSWLASHPPDATSESSMDLFELVRILAMRTTLTPQMLL